MVKAKYKPFHALFKSVMQDSDLKVDHLCQLSKNLQNNSLQYEHLRVNLQNLLSSNLTIGNNVNVYFYGSRISGLATSDSDLDIYVEIGQFYD
jgi:hypothetical protein